MSLYNQCRYLMSFYYPANAQPALQSAHATSDLTKQCEILDENQS